MFQNSEPNLFFSIIFKMFLYKCVLQIKWWLFTLIIHYILMCRGYFKLMYQQIIFRDWRAFPTRWTCYVKTIDKENPLEWKTICINLSSTTCIFYFTFIFFLIINPYALYRLDCFSADNFVILNLNQSQQRDENEVTLKNNCLQRVYIEMY